MKLTTLYQISSLAESVAEKAHWLEADGGTERAIVALGALADMAISMARIADVAERSEERR